ncbi:MAG: hypothetical protein FJ102_00580 [Deltaproteobacteria bacterium]|nr:hypothetical protein [Deltaproteobacteria bacterium]
MDYYLARLLHLAAIAAWFGAMMFITGDTRYTVARLGDFLGLADRARRVARAARIASVVVLLTGFYLVYALGGLGSVPVAVHVGLFNTLVLVGVQATYFRTLDALLANSTDPVALGRLRWLGPAFHALWFATLALMVFQKVIG